MIEFVVGDTKPDLSFALDEDGVDATADGDVTAVEFRLKLPDIVITKQLSLVTHADGTQAWEGNYGVGELDVSGVFLGEVVVFRGSDNPQHAKEPVRVVVRGEFAEVS